MPTITIYHNPRCSKSRQTLALLHEKGYTPTVVEYLQTPISEKTLKKLLQMLALSPRELMRRGEPIYKELSLDNSELSDAQLIQMMTAHPILIERPIVVAGDKARIGRPPEKVLEILS